MQIVWLWLGSDTVVPCRHITARVPYSESQTSTHASSQPARIEPIGHMSEFLILEF